MQDPNHVFGVVYSATKKTFDDIKAEIDQAQLDITQNTSDISQLQSDVENINVTTLTGVESLKFDTTGDEEFGLPAGTTAQRPASPSNGYMRYNTTEESVEAYINGQWVTVKDNPPARGGVSWNATADSYADADADFTIGAVDGIHTEMKRCVMNDAGVVQYYLDPTDSTKKSDGSSANLDGTDGQVMVEIPKFYIKKEYSSPTHTWKISSRAESGFTVHPAFVKAGVEVDFRYMGAYEGIWFDDTISDFADPDNSNGLNPDTTNDKLGSISGQYPIVGVTRAEARSLAENRGIGWHQQDWYLTSAVQLLFLVEFGDFNSQASISAGNTQYSSWSTGSGDTRTNQSGLSNSDGNGSGGTSTGGGSTSDYCTYRGIENFWGSVFQWVDGIVVNPNEGDADGWYATNDYRDFLDDNITGHDKITSSMPGDGFITDIVDTVEGFIPESTGGSSSTFITDRFFDDNGNTDRVVWFGGNAIDGGEAGAFGWDVYDDSAERNRDIGARLCY
jgi:hypothetical protein